eukprot:11210751-Lingulodinium_polyedra.AAC.1
MSPGRSRGCRPKAPAWAEAVRSSLPIAGPCAGTSADTTRSSLCPLISPRRPSAEHVHCGPPSSSGRSTTLC